ncbi:alpha/beta fold hydrolase [Fundidesulfovibrio soli]|uniref:alpha/beta fold hydrolase n=1 Tax=Fundidesulfovibrio soli TaxID=2922716 RepID=UPI001FAF30B1|nr:alpha/beta hydrolase [Fundidesulfovibrio soli]
MAQTPLGIHYEVHGAGPPLVLLAGLTMDGSSWSGLLRQLTRHFLVLTHDPRGSGRSGAPLAGFSVEMMAEDALSVMDAQGVDKAHVLGFSLGGMAALDLAAKHAGRVGRLVLASTGMKMRPGRVMAMRLAQQLLAEGGSMSQSLGAMLPWLLGDRALSEGRLARAFALRRHPLNAEGFGAQCEALEAFDGHGLEASVTAQALCISGDEDILLPPAENGLAEAFPDARHVLLAGCAHMSYMERPEAFASAVLDFLLSR